jgi:ABC-2 type transport system ATP-binding protein
VLHTEGLTKQFPGGQVAVDELDLTVPVGSVFGFLGPNGSGKTTTIRMLLGLISPTKGSFELLGRSMPDAAGQVLPRVGALIEGPAFYPYLSGRDNLLRLDAADRTVSGRGARQRVDEALQRVGLGAAATKRYRANSSCWTSRPTDSTLRGRARCGPSSATSEPAARRCSCRRTC